MATNAQIEQASYDAVLRQASKQKGTTFNLKKTYPAYLTLAVFLVISFYVWQFFKERLETDEKIAYGKATTSVMSRLEGTYNSYHQVLQTLNDIYNKSYTVSRDYFILYSLSPTQTYKSLISMMFVPRVLNKELDFHIFEAQRQGLFYYKIRPQGSRDEYFPIQMIEPYDDLSTKINSPLAGYDLNMNDFIKPFIEKSRDNNIFVSSPIDVLPERDSIGFYLIAPVYQKDMPITNKEEREQYYRGVLIEEISSLRFFEESIGSGIPSDTTILFEIIETGKANNEMQIYKSKNFPSIDLKSYFPLYEERILKIADRDIKVRFYTIPNFSTSLQKSLPIIALVISLLVSLAFFGFLLSVITSRARAVDLAERMTRSQRRIVETSKDIIAVLNFEGIWMSMNQACQKIFQYTPNDLIGQKIDMLFIEQLDMKNFYHSLEAIDDEQTLRIDVQMKTKTEDKRWVSWSFTISKTDQLVYCIGRDVTLEKIAEEQAKLRSKQIQLAEQFTREASEFKSYFMNKLSHQMRNSLTGIIGYLQLLEQNLYEDQEEHDSYVQLALESSEEIFTFVSDMIEISLGNEEETYKQIILLPFERVVEETKNSLKGEISKDIQFDMTINDESVGSKVLADMSMLVEAMKHLCTALVQGVEKVDIQVNATENPYEGATEVQLLTSANPVVADLIEIYKFNQDKLIDALKVDKHDILLQFAIAASNFRLMNGTMNLETFGGDDGNVVQITLPSTKLK